MNNRAKETINNAYSDNFKLKASASSVTNVLSTTNNSICIANTLCSMFPRNGKEEYQFWGRKISKLRNSHDTLILAPSTEELEHIMNILNREYGLKIHTPKAKVMIITRIRNNQPETQHLAGYEVLSRFNYLSSVVINNGRCVQTRKKLMRFNGRISSSLAALVFSVATYAAKSQRIMASGTCVVEWCAYFEQNNAQIY